MLLRPYQADALARVQAVYRSGKRRALLVAPTGSGKSTMTSYMLARSQKRTLILCHRAELLDQIASGIPVPFGIIGGSRSTPLERVHLGMMQTVARRLEKLDRYDWVVSDEAHLAMCPTWRTILKHYANAWHLGMSATPCRLDGIGLGAEYEQIVYGPSIRELTAGGYLVPCRVFAPPLKIDVPRTKSGSDNLNEAAEQLDTRGITGDAIEHQRRIAGDRQTLVFCCTRKHAANVAREFQAAGISAANVDGGMPDAEQKQIVGAFRAKRLQVLVNVELLTTGFDCPQIGAAVFLRPTQSLALYLQMVGRILRPFPCKRDAILLDHVGNVIAHGMPDMDREWTLDGRARKVQTKAVAQCPACYAAHHPAPKCPNCGFVYGGGDGRPALANRDGELEEMTPERLEYLRTAKLPELIAAARGRADFEAIRFARGYRPGWVRVQMMLRERAMTRRAA